ncbi:MAG TPA: pre-peptidase C-terminal domain-containing protein [Mycobacteriales bacterium]|nr:pre-peptidase C-terminal domain-containing protein [Mycobacteriales bacterium]
MRRARLTAAITAACVTVGLASVAPHAAAATPTQDPHIRVVTRSGLPDGSAAVRTVANADGTTNVVVTNVANAETSLLLERSWADATYPSFAASEPWDVTTQAGARWYRVVIHGAPAAHTVTVGSFTPARSPRFTLGSPETVRLTDRPMFVSLVPSSPGHEDELGVELYDGDSAGQQVVYNDAWLRGLGFTSPGFRYADGTRIHANHTAAGWAVDAPHFSTIYTFDASHEGFAQQNPQTYSEVGWDSTNHRISFVGDRRDGGDEMFTHALPAQFTTGTSFTVTSRWATTAQGNWQAGEPLFLTANAATDAATAASSVYVYYYSRDANVGQAPQYFLRYRDAAGVLRIDQAYTAAANTEYRFYVDYSATTHVLTMKIRNAAGTDLFTATYTTGTNANDGFTLDKVGVANDGTGNTQEPAINGWADDITIDSTTGGGGGGTTVTYTFDSTNEGFAQQQAQTYSEVAWDSANHRVSVLGDRRDTGDEMFTHALPAQLTTASSFTVSSRWATTAQGNWQAAEPLFLGATAVTDVDSSPSSVYVYYDSRDGNIGQAPQYGLRYRDAAGVLRINQTYTATANTEYRFVVSYSATTHVLTMKVRNAANTTDLLTATYTTGTNANDGFTLNKVGVANNGTGNTQEPAVTAWVDDIVVDTTGGGGGGGGTGLNEGFDGTVTGWAFTGLWHVKTTSRAVSPSKTIWYGDDTKGNYDVGVTAGTATSPAFTVPATTPTLSFKSWHQTESLPYDKKSVEISTNGGSTWTQLMQLDDAQQTWNSESTSLSAYAGQSVRIRFAFDSVDGVANAYEGWYVDDVVVSSAGVNNPPALAFTGESGYTGDGVAPDSGDTTTSFTFKVKVTDDGASMSYVKVYLDGDSGHDMTKVSGTLSTGAIYSYTTTLAQGSHSYHFGASDGTNTAARLPSTGELSGPSVSQGPGLYLPTVSPTLGTSAAQYVFQVQYFHPQDQAPTDVRVVVDGTSYLMSPVDYGDTTYSDGRLYHLPLKLKAVAHSYYFTATSGTPPQVISNFRNPASGTISGPMVGRANQPPVAEFNIQVKDGSTAKREADTGSLVWVDAAPSGDDSDEDPATYTWSWGDGTTTSGMTSSHKYTSDNNGTPYNITLTASDQDGSTTRTKPVVVNSNELRPATAETDSFTAAGQQRMWRFYVPVGMVNLKVDLAGPAAVGTDFDLYVRAGAKPTTSVYDARGFGLTATESVTVNNPQRGWYYVMVNALSGTGSFSVTANATGTGSLRTYVADDFDTGSAPGWTLGGQASVVAQEGAAHSGYYGLYLLANSTASTAYASKPLGASVSGTFSAQAWVTVPYADTPFQDFTLLQLGPSPTSPEIKLAFKDNNHSLDVFANGTWTMDVIAMPAGTYMPIRMQAGPSQWELYVFDELRGVYPRSGSAVAYVGQLGDSSTTTGIGEAYLDDIVFRTGDTDTDGVADVDEVTGKDISINGSTRRVSSDPYFWDTDGDYRSDNSEMNSSVVSDPRLSDTDNDGLYDGIETDVRVNKSPTTPNVIRTAGVDAGNDKVSYGVYIEGSISGDLDVIVPFISLSFTGMSVRGVYDITNEEAHLETQAFIGLPGLEINPFSVDCTPTLSCGANVGFTMTMNESDKPNWELGVGFVTVGFAWGTPLYVDVHPTDWYLTPAIHWIYAQGTIGQSATMADGTEAPISVVRTSDGVLHYVAGSYSMVNGHFSAAHELPSAPAGFDPSTLLPTRAVDLL